MKLSPKPRILRVSNRFNVGGPTYNVAYLSKYLSDEFETTLVAGNIEPYEGSATYILDHLGIAYSTVPQMFRNIHPRKDWIALKYLVSLISSLKPDIVHTHAAKAGALGRLATILSSHKVPVVVHTYHGNVFDGYFSPLKERVFLAIERFLARKSSAIIAISNSQKHDLVYKYKIAPENKVHVIPLGFDLNRMTINVQNKRLQFRDEFSLNDDVVVVSIIGRLTAIKNHELFLRVFKRSKEQTNTSIKAFIVGDGEERKNLQNLCDLIGLSWSCPDSTKADVDVYFTSWRKDIDVVNAGSDIIMLTSKNEGTPVSIIEAMAAGRAVISTDVGGVRDIINNRITGLIVSNDENEFTKSLIELVENVDFRLSLGKQAQPEVLTKFGYQRLVDDVSTLYHKLLADNKKEKSFK